MNDDNELDPIARLRATDPAAGVEPRAGFADDVVARTLGEPAVETETEPGTAAETESAPVTDLTSERVRRRPRWIQIAAVAASVALVGGAGFGLGALTGGESTNAASGAGAPISLPAGAGTTDQMPEGAAAQSGFAGASSAQSKSSAGLSDRMFPYSLGRNSFSASGLSTSAGSAAAYTFDARGSSNAATVAALAAALGVEGTPEQRDGAWFVGSPDGSTSFVSVSLDGTLSFSFTDPLINPWDCGLDAAATESCDPPTDLPSESAAIDALRALIVSVGRDADAYEFTSESWEGSFTRSAQASLLIDGQRVDQSWSIELTSAGTYSAYGSLANVVPLGDYTILSEQDAFERLSDPRFGAQMTAMPMAVRELSATAEEWVAPTEPPATPTAETPLSWSVNQVQIVSARLGLASQWQPDGSVLVVPAYEFTDAEGATWSVIAVADSQLDFSTE